MKKYIKPVMEVTEVEVGVILAGSGTTPSTTTSDELIKDDTEILPSKQRQSFGINSPHFFIIRYIEGAS